MSKFKNGFVKQYKAELEFKKNQEKLKTQYGIDENDNRIVVEKKSGVKYLLLGIGSVIQVCATIIILLLAIVGLTVLANPTTRTALLSIIPIII